jgi:hypothetical protein
VSERGTCEGCRHLSTWSKDYGQPKKKYITIFGKKICYSDESKGRWEYLNYRGVWYHFCCWLNPGGEKLDLNETNTFPIRCGQYAKAIGDNT